MAHAIKLEPHPNLPHSFPGIRRAQERWFSHGPQSGLLQDIPGSVVVGLMYDILQVILFLSCAVIMRACSNLVHHPHAAALAMFARGYKRQCLLASDATRKGRPLFPTHTLLFLTMSSLRRRTADFEASEYVRQKDDEGLGNVKSQI